MTWSLIPWRLVGAAAAVIAALWLYFDHVGDIRDEAHAQGHAEGVHEARVDMATRLAKARVEAAERARNDLRREYDEIDAAPPLPPVRLCEPDENDRARPVRAPAPAPRDHRGSQAPRVVPQRDAAALGRFSRELDRLARDLDYYKKEAERVNAALAACVRQYQSGASRACAPDVASTEAQLMQAFRSGYRPVIFRCRVA